MDAANPFTKLWRHRDLVTQFTRREVELRHKGSRLGHLWALISPLTMLALYMFVFGFIFGGRFGVLPDENTVDFAFAMFLGLSLFNVISESISVAPMLVVSQPNFVKKVVFPLEIIPISSVATSLYHSLFSLGLLLVMAPFSHGFSERAIAAHTLDWSVLLALPALLLPLGMIALGLSWGLAAVGVFVRDISQITALLATAIMYASAVVYSPSRVPPGIWAVLRYNPILVIMDEARKLVLWHMRPDYGPLAYAYGLAALTLALGYAVFSILRPYFAEVL
jgi:lipopolysaccharide transport system permease protein